MKSRGCKIICLLFDCAASTFYPRSTPFSHLVSTKVASFQRESYAARSWGTREDVVNFISRLNVSEIRTFLIEKYILRGSPARFIVPLKQGIKFWEFLYVSLPVKYRCVCFTGLKLQGIKRLKTEARGSEIEQKM